MNLIEFLNSSDINAEVEIAVSERLKDKETGEYYKFKIRPLTDKEWEEARSSSTTLPKSKKEVAKFNASKFNEKVVINCTTFPNFKDAENLKKVNCISPEQYLHKVLLPGEVNKLSDEIVKLSGFDSNIEELADEAKN